MPPSVQHASVDPLHSFMAGAFVVGTQQPIPLVGTRFDVTINSGLATVSTKRTFRNSETQSIEATITFPVPVHAVLFLLEARIEGRLLKAHAQSKTQARDSYEDAIERGKAAVLHEEVLRGVHMLSVGHIAPGAEIEVTAIWAITLSNIVSGAHLRIPLTVGDIYGSSGLPDSDELTHGGSVQKGELTVECLDGAVTRLGGRLDGGRAEVPLNAPIDLLVTGWVPHDLRGRAADGRDVILRIEPFGSGDGFLDLALAIDHSGSMAEVCSSAHLSLTKHQAVTSSLQAIAGTLYHSDVVDVWEFSNSLKHIGRSRETDGVFAGEPTEAGKTFTRLIQGLSGPSGGTEIGTALAGVTAQSKVQDILLITDGKSHALDVQALARTGRRFSVVLIGEDSLEANVGHLAAITGGEIFVAAGGDLAGALSAALSSLRASHENARKIAGELEQINVSRSNMFLTAQWRPASEPAEDTLGARAVAAIAASLVLPFLDHETAAQLAEAEGLVTHLTSLILVDDAAAAQSGIPANRKIALPSPRTAKHSGVREQAMFCRSAGVMEDSALRYLPAYSEPQPSRQRRSFSLLSSLRSVLRRRPQNGASDQTIRNDERADDFLRAELPSHFSFLASMIDWDAAPNRLQVGDLSVLDTGVAGEIHMLALSTSLQDLARLLQIEPVVLIIGLVANIQSTKNRSAARIAKAIIGHISAEDLMRLLNERGLAPHSSQS